MATDLKSLTQFGAYALSLWQLLKLARWLFQYLQGVRKAEPSPNEKSTPEPARFLSALVGVAALVPGLVLMLVLALQQTSTSARIMLLLAGGVAVLSEAGMLFLVLGVPGYKYVMDLRYRVMSLVHQVRGFEKRLIALEQIQAQNEIAETLPVQRKLAFMENATTGGARGEYIRDHRLENASKGGVVRQANIAAL